MQAKRWVSSFWEWRTSWCHHGRFFGFWDQIFASSARSAGSHARARFAGRHGRPSVTRPLPMSSRKKQRKARKHAGSWNTPGRRRRRDTKTQARGLEGWQCGCLCITTLYGTLCRCANPLPQRQHHPPVDVGMPRFRPAWIVVWLVALMLGLYHELKMAAFHTHSGDDSSSFLPPSEKERSMAACLMVRDDNQLLSEWLAYHYTVLPLRDLVIAADYGSVENPALVVEKWRDTSLKYTIWNSTDFMSRFGEIPVSEDDANHHYLHRQRAFITSCIEYFKRKNRTWVALVDTDEYIVLNHMPIENASLSGMQRQAAASSATVLQALYAANAVSPLEICHGMPRLLYGALENETCPEAQSTKDMIRSGGFSYPTTVRYVQHAEKGAFYPSKWGKVLIDVSRITWESLGRKPKSTHRPFQECPKPLFSFQDSILQVNHYLGSWERYSSRQDERRSREAFEKRAYFSNGVSCQDQLWKWFPTFVNNFGETKAKYLLG